MKVLVTGSSRGLGAEIIKIFAANGVDVIINYNHSEKEAYKREYNTREKAYHNRRADRFMRGVHIFFARKLCNEDVRPDRKPDE